MEITDEGVKFVAAVLALAALPVSAIAKAVNLSRDVKQVNEEAIARDNRIEEQARLRVEAHERLCEERMRHIMDGQGQIIHALENLQNRA